MKKVLSQNIGDTVLCDLCNKDYTNSDEEGGFIFGSKAVCPDCSPGMMRNIKRYDEQEFITATCPDGVSFKQFVVNFRGGDNEISLFA